MIGAGHCVKYTKNIYFMEMVKTNVYWQLQVLTSPDPHVIEGIKQFNMCWYYWILTLMDVFFLFFFHLFPMFFDLQNKTD